MSFTFFQPFNALFLGQRLQFCVFQASIGHAVSTDTIKWRKVQDPSDENKTIIFAEDDEVDLSDCMERLKEDLPEANQPVLTGQE